MPIRILLADDSLIVRTGIGQLLAEEPDVEVVGAVGDLPCLLEHAERLRPDVVVSDVRMPPTMTDEGIAAAVRFRTVLPEVAVLVLSQAADPSFVHRLIDGGSSKRGYLLKDNLATPGELITAIRVVQAGGSFIDPMVVDLLVTKQSGRRSSPMDFLTPRETQILAAIASGKSNQAIAEELVVSHRAVEKHINSMFAKLQIVDDPEVNRRVQAVLLFLGND